MKRAVWVCLVLIMAVMLLATDLVAKDLPKVQASQEKCLHMQHWEGCSAPPYNWEGDQEVWKIVPDRYFAKPYCPFGLTHWVVWAYCEDGSCSPDKSVNYQLDDWCCPKGSTPEKMHCGE